LKNIRKEYDEAENHYKKALDIEPNHANINGNYANFLSDIRNDYDEAEKYYKKALGIEPNHANKNGNYALFLSDIRKEYDEAEKYYKKALDIEPNSANKNGNYAGFLLAKNNKKLANKYLDTAFKYVNNHKDLLSELWFYRLAHYPEFRNQAIKELDELLKNGAKSIGWDFSDNINQAKKEGFKPIELLQKYADKITIID
jgi:Tfp pilus assembly protein PilF